jgi:hypothetical protein
MGRADRPETPLLAMVELEAGEQPADRAVAQRRHRIRDAGVDQRLRADQAARAAGAVDDDARGRVRRQVACPQHQLGTGHAGAGGDAHRAVLVPAAHVEHDHVGAGVEQRLHFFGRQRRRAGVVLDEFAEGLARHIDVAEQFAAAAPPAVEPAVEQAHRRPARCGEPARGRFGQAFAVVVDHHRHISARQPPGRVELEPRARDLHCEQRVFLRERVFLARVEQRDLAALQQHRAHVFGGQPRQFWVHIFTSSQTAR